MEIKIAANPRYTKDVYPKLMIDTKDGEIILIEDKEGMSITLNESQDNYQIGGYSESRDLSNFIDFHGSITLSN